MKAKDILTETPQMISGVSDIDSKMLQNDCVNALNRDGTEIVKRFSETIALYHSVKSKQEGLYFLANEDYIDYACNYKKVELSEKTLPVKTGARQVLIKRFPNASPFAAGIGASIFWDYLFKDFDCLISDSQQSPDGKSFWEYRIKEALEKKLTVRMINTNDNTFVDIKDIAHLTVLKPNIWGTSKWFQRVVIAIYKAEE